MRNHRYEIGLPSVFEYVQKQMYMICDMFLCPHLALQAEMDSFTSRKMLILVSTVMTWAVTKPRDLVRPQEHSVTVGLLLE